MVKLKANLNLALIPFEKRNADWSDHPLFQSERSILMVSLARRRFFGAVTRDNVQSKEDEFFTSKENGL